MATTSTGSPLVIVGAVIFAIAIAAFLIISYFHRRKESFEGEVIDKDIKEIVNQNMNNMNNQPGTITLSGTNNVTHEYRVKVKTTAGKEISWKVSEGKYQIIKIGDKVSKPTGTTELTIVNSAAAPTATPPTSPAAPTPTPTNPV